MGYLNCTPSEALIYNLFTTKYEGIYGGPADLEECKGWLDELEEDLKYGRELYKKALTEEPWAEVIV